VFFFFFLMLICIKKAFLYSQKAVQFLKEDNAYCEQ